MERMNFETLHATQHKIVLLQSKRRNGKLKSSAQIIASHTRNWGQFAAERPLLRGKLVDIAAAAA